MTSQPALPTVRHSILVVDDEEAFRVGLELGLRKEGYEVRIAATGAEALAALDEETFDVVVSDIRMPQMDGLELLQKVKERGETPVILMTGFSDLIETYKAHHGGAAGFLAKPFQRADLVATLERVLGEKGSGEGLHDGDFSKVYILDFVSGRQIRYDIFIRLAPDKYVKVAHQGVDLPLERLKSYQAKGVTHLYLRKGDFKRYVGFATMLAKKAAHSDQVSNDAKVRFLNHASEVITQQLVSERLDADLFENSKTFVEATLQVVSEQGEIIELLEALNAHADHLFAHSLGVSMYGVMLAREMGWISPLNLFKICLGGLLHDVGKKQVPAHILKKPRFHWTEDEVRSYESHPECGIKLIESMEGLAGDVVEIIRAHHEDCQGRGFPLQLKEQSIHPLARLVAVANEFVRLVVKSPDGDPLPLDKAVQKLYKQHRAGLDPRFFEALARVCKVEMATLAS